MELAQIYTDFRGTLLSYIKAKVTNEQDAEDILHDTFIKVASNLDSVNRHEKLRNWIFTVTRNNVMDFYRKKAGNKQVSLPDNLLNEPTEEEYNDITKGLDCCLMNFVNQLPDEYRSILTDVELNGAKQKDLTNKYGLAYSSIRSRVQRGREKLKDILLKCCAIESDSWGNILQVDKRDSCNSSLPKSCKE